MFLLRKTSQKITRDVLLFQKYPLYIISVIHQLWIVNRIPDYFKKFFYFTSAPGFSIKMQLIRYLRAFSCELAISSQLLAYPVNVQANGWRLRAGSSQARTCRNDQMFSECLLLCKY